jgi:hypothetical protein
MPHDQTCHLGTSRLVRPLDLERNCSSGIRFPSSRDAPHDYRETNLSHEVGAAPMPPPRGRLATDTRDAVCAPFTSVRRSDKARVNYTGM